jgi:hypothetical protein
VELDAVGVIVPARNEEANIDRCLDSITFAVRRCCVPVVTLVVLDSCTDSTARRVAAHPEVDTLVSNETCVGAARRAGVLEVLASVACDPARIWLAHTDADSATPPGWLEYMVAAARVGVDLVLGTVIPDLAESELLRAWEREPRDSWQRLPGCGWVFQRLFGRGRRPGRTGVRAVPAVHAENRGDTCPHKRSARRPSLDGVRPLPRRPRHPARGSRRMSTRPRVSVATFASWCDRACAWPLPGSGNTARRWSLLAGLGAEDLALVRLVEAHADAVAIVAELGGPSVSPGQRWGVWAAGPPGSVTASAEGGVWRLKGTKAWCSGATIVTHALVDAATGTGQRLFAVDVRDPEVDTGEAAWDGIGMAAADTRQVSFGEVAATPIGGSGSYLDRPGFWAGAIGVAACWSGGAAQVARTLHKAARTRRDPHLLAHLGGVHVALYENVAVLAAAADEVDRRPNADHAVLARSVRSTVEQNAAEVMTRVGRALGPGPMAHDGEYAQLVADLTVYIRQHHAEVDLEALGRQVAEGEPIWLI